MKQSQRVISDDTEELDGEMPGFDRFFCDAKGVVVETSDLVIPCHIAICICIKAGQMSK
jgi:hypothetical protein